LEKEPQLKDVCDRIARLYQQGGSEPIERDILGLLEREVAYSPTQLNYLAGLKRNIYPKVAQMRQMLESQLPPPQL
jgi:hypothetical protein